MIAWKTPGAQISKIEQRAGEPYSQCHPAREPSMAGGRAPRKRPFAGETKAQSLRIRVILFVFA